MAGETVTPERGALVRQESGAELQVMASVNAEALAKREEALIRSKVYMARQFPRVIETVEARLVHECKRPLFAERARYAIPRSTYEDGKKVTKTITGFSVRFADAAMRNFGNLDVRQLIISEDSALRVIEVQVIDYETMVGDSRQIAIAKTIERKRVFPNQEVLAERRNATTGEVIYIIAASEMDLLAKTNSMISRARRNLVLELVPADVLAACEQQVIATQADTDRKDPDAAKKRVLEAFALLGITPGQLLNYLGKPLVDMTEHDLKELRGVHEAVRSGESTWADLLEERRGPAAGSVAPPEAKSATSEPVATPPKHQGEPAPAAAQSRGVQQAQVITATPGTGEYAVQLLSLIELAEDVYTLRQLAGLHKAAPKEEAGKIAAKYEARLNALQKKEAK